MRISIERFILTMWYVNLFRSTGILSTSFSFILTMWYVNDNTVIDNVFKANGFILTMWYVNIYQYGEIN